MYSIRKWMFKPKRSDKSLLARLYYADEALNAVAAELDSFDGRKEPERCTLLINKLRNCQDKVLGYVEKIMEDAISDRRASRDFRVKFPDDVLQDNLAGQLWFGAECLSAGSSIMNREVESASMRPLARSLTRHLDQLRTLLREHCLRNQAVYPDELKQSLQVFDKLFSEFELSYVSAMVPVKTMRDYDILQEVMVLFSETIQEALKQGLITQDMLDDYDPVLMFTIPRLAIVCGLITYPEGPLNPDMDPVNMCEMFRPFQTLLYKIRELLATLTVQELYILEKCLCSSEEPADLTDMMTNQVKQENKTHKNERFATTSNIPSSNVSGALNSNSASSSAVKTNSETSLNQANKSGNSGTKPLTVMSVDNSQKDVSSSDSDMTYDSDSSIGDGSSSESVSSHDSEGEMTNSHHTKAERTCHKTEQKSQSGMKKSMPHQESKDSGMPSEPDPMTFETHTVDSHRLRHSRSWPETSRTNNSGAKKKAHSKSPSMNEYLPKGGGGASGGGAGLSMGGPSLELIDSSHSDSDMDLGFLNRSAQEFTFNIPRNTSLDHPSDNEQVLVPSYEGATGSDPDKASCEADRVAYVTEALSSAFATDPDDTNKVALLQSDSTVLPPGTILSDNNENDENEICTKCNKDNLASSSDESKFCDKTCDTECTASAKSDVDGNSRIKSPTCVQTGIEHSLDATSTCGESSKESKVMADKTTRSAHEKPACEEIPQTASATIRRHQDQKNNNRPSLDNSGNSSSRNRDSVQDSSNKPGTSTCTQERKTKLDKSASTSKDVGKGKKTPVAVPRSNKVHYRRMRSSESSRSKQADKDSISSGDSVSHSSEAPEESEITLAIQAAEIAARKEARARFKSSGELIHRLFVCISGVADQLQTNYASDLRHILKCVFECNSSDVAPELPTEEKTLLQDTFVNITGPEPPLSVQPIEEEQGPAVETEGQADTTELCTEAPVWVPDEQVTKCTACKAIFTFVRRRHHCRNCGNIFCGRCSSNNVPLPQYGHDKPVRVCNRCFVFHVTPFTSVDE